MAKVPQLEQLQHLRSLKVAVAVAFLGNKPVVRPVFHEVYCFTKSTGYKRDERLRQYIKAGLLLGVKAPGMTEARFKTITAQVSKAIQMVILCKFQWDDTTATTIWDAHQEQVVQASAIRLQNEWRAATSDPSRAICCKRLRREFEEMTGDA